MKLSIAAITCLTLVGFATAQAAGPVRLGVVAPFSGPLARFGVGMQCGIQTYQALHGTSAGGVEIEVEFRDTGGGNPARARQVAQELVVRGQVDFLGGFIFSPNAAAAAQVVTKAKIPTLIFGAIQAELTRASPYIVRLSYTEQQVVGPLADWAASNGIKSVITVVSDYSTGHGNEEGFTVAFTKAGGAVVEKMRIPLSTTDYSPYFEKILQARPDAVFVSAPGGQPAIGMIKTWEARGLKDAGIKLLATGNTQQIDLPMIGDAAVGVVSSFSYTTSNESPLNIAMRKEMAQQCEGVIADFTAVAAYDGMHVIYETLRKLGPTFDSDAAILAMKGMSFESPRGPIVIDPATRDVIQNVYLRRVEKLNGELINVDLKVVPMVKDPWKEANPEG